MYNDKFLIYLQTKLIDLQKSSIEKPYKQSRIKYELAIKELEEIIEEYKKLEKNLP